MRYEQHSRTPQPQMRKEPQRNIGAPQSNHASDATLVVARIRYVAIARGSPLRVALVRVSL